MLERKDNNASQEELFHHQSHSPQSEVIQKANMFAAVWINKFAHAQLHREPLTESLKNLANDCKESVHWEPVLNKNRFSIPIPIDKGNILKHNWQSMNWRIIVSNGRVSEEKYYISGSPAVIIVYGQLPPRSWSTIGCHYSSPPLSITGIRIRHQRPPRLFDPQIIIHDVATAGALDLRPIRQRACGEEVKSVRCIDEIWISLIW